jgi:hypothetical protein
MIGGTPILGILALLLYGLSAAFVPASLSEAQDRLLSGDPVE